jgi:hypothetical protein
MAINTTIHTTKTIVEINCFYIRVISLNFVILYQALLHMIKVISCIICLLVPFAGCQAQQNIVVRNPTALERKAETVNIPAGKLKSILSRIKSVQVKDPTAGTILPVQWIDLDSDGVDDELIFQVDIGPLKEKMFLLEESRQKNEPGTYSRFVPERIDDYAWENDRVAFRTYGPRAQQITEGGKPGGTLSSGIDCWLKRVDYPVIDRWYKKNSEGGSYHKDTGEGLDNYHVGASRGCGGIGVWADDSLYVSKNFVSYKIIANGPIRTIFELTYAPWTANGITIREKKRISIDLGSQLSRYEVTLQSNASLPNVTTGITLHDKKGKTHLDSIQGWFSYWEPLEDSELGTGIVVDPAFLQSCRDHRTDKKDLSQLYVLLKPGATNLVYYSGFGWKKAGRFNSSAEWNAYLEHFSKQMRSPLEVNVLP